jgi:hypothetical protein
VTEVPERLASQGDDQHGREIPYRRKIMTDRERITGFTLEGGKKLEITRGSESEVEVPTQVQTIPTDR